MKKQSTPVRSVMLVIQGEGRGHLTQAIAMQEILAHRGYEICCVVVGTNGNRTLPPFFVSKFSAPIVPLASPGFSMDKNRVGIRLLPTVWTNACRLPRFFRSIQILRKLVLFHQPELVINFYEPLMGLYQWWYGNTLPVVSIAHQYVYLHEAFRFTGGRPMEHRMLRFYTRLTAFGSVKRLAISARRLPETGRSEVVLVPPLLRREVRQAPVGRHDFFLVYLLNEGYMESIMAWHRAHPEVVLHCFTDSREVREKHGGCWKVDGRLIFHSLNDTLFLSLMAHCRGVATTAGFETVCEAMYLGKPVLMVPVEGHAEQACNATDFAEMGAGVWAHEFRLERLTAFVEQQVARPDAFRAWVDQAEALIGTHLSAGPRPMDEADPVQAPLIDMHNGMDRRPAVG